MAKSDKLPAGMIFVSYRRDESAYAATWLYDRLVSRYGSSRVFRDFDTISPGADFYKEIANALKSCTALLAVIGRGWVTAAAKDGRRRLDDPDDWVRLEIETALSRGIRIIPVLVDGARMPCETDLPTTMAELAHRQAVELRPETSNISDLISRLGVTAADSIREVLGRNIQIYQSEPWTRKPLSLEAESTAGGRVNARSAILEWVERKDSQLIVVAGEFGCGKTWLLRWLAYELSSRRLAGDHSVPVPIIVRLDRLINYRIRNMEDLLESSDSHIEWPVLSNTADEIILLLDGLDELTELANNSDQRISSILQSIREIVPPSVRFVISCRTYALESAPVKDSLAEFSRPTDRLDLTSWATKSALRGEARGLNVLRILELSPEDSDAYLLNSQVAAIWTQVRDGPAYRALARLPWTVYLLKEALPALSVRSSSPELYELYNAAILTWLARYGMKHHGIQEARIQLENLAVSGVRRSRGTLRDDFIKAGILIRTFDGGCRFRHYSLLEYFFACALYRELQSFNSDLLSRVDLLSGYGINRFLVPMLLSEMASADEPSRAETASTPPGHMVSAEEFKRFMKETGWRNSGFGRWPGFTAPDGTVSMSLAYGPDESREKILTSTFWHKGSGPATGVSFYDAIQFCRWSGGRLPTYKELRSNLTIQPHGYREWSCSWYRESAAWIAVARSLPRKGNLENAQVEEEGINPDLRLPDLGFRAVRPVS